LNTTSATSSESLKCTLNCSKAVAINVEWCDVVVKSHGIRTERANGYSKAEATLPPYYPNLITHKKRWTAQEASALLADLPATCSVKDS